MVWERRKRNGFIAALLGAILLLIAGLAIGAAFLFVHNQAAKTRTDFRSIDAVAESLALGNLGSIKVDRKSGGRQVLEGQPATRTLVVQVLDRTPAEVQSEVGARLAASGYRTADLLGAFCASDAPCRYRNPSNGVGIVLVVLRPGEQVREGLSSRLVVGPKDTVLDIGFTKAL